MRGKLESRVNRTANAEPSQAPVAEGLPREAALLRRRVLDWLETMRVQDDAVGAYRMNAGADASVFNSCFAAFLRHLFNDVSSLSDGERREWLDYIQSFQDEATGLFVYPAAAARVLNEGHDEEHLNRQLTTFCLSAIEALGGTVRYPFAFLQPWKDPGEITAWLEGLRWSRPWNCGNKVMFMGIFLAYSWETWNDVKAREALGIWFDWLDRYQNPETGFWGEGRSAEYYMGMGGAYHEFLVYNYSGREIHHAERIVDRILLLQQPDGLYAPQQGGGSCDDIDAIDPLVHFYHRYDYRRQEIRDSLRRSLRAIRANQNSDGGFCWAKPYRFGAADYYRVTTDIFRHGHSFLWYWNARRGIRDQRPAAQERLIHTGWNNEGRARWQSSIFDTWFRCTSIGEICSVLTAEPEAAIDWRFLTAPGLGWFQPLSTEEDPHR